MDSRQDEFVSQLYREMYYQLMAYAKSALANEALAEEAVQDAQFGWGEVLAFHLCFWFNERLDWLETACGIRGSLGPSICQGLFSRKSSIRRRARLTFPGMAGMASR